MRRLSSGSHCWHLAWVLSVALAGCATAPLRPPLDVAQQRELVLSLDGFSLAGSVAVRRAAGAAPAQGMQATLNWEQQQDLTKVKLSGPIFAGSLELEYRPGQLRLVSSRGGTLTNADAEQALADELGFVPPFDALRYWIRGVPAPGIAASETHDPAGLLQQLEQQDWLIRYDRYVSVDTGAGKVQLPAKLVATRDDLRLTLVTYRWRMK